MKEYISQVYKRIFRDVKEYWIVAVSYFIYYFLSLHIFKASCPVVFVTGLPCPGCGMTRAVIAILRFDFAKAFELNPVSFPIVLFVIAFFFFRYFIGKTPKVFKVFFAILGVMLFLRYLYGMIKWYPNRIPYVYSKKSLFYLITHLH